MSLAEKLSALASEAYASEGNKDARAAHIAEMFCAMSDDGQAQFFVHVARIMDEWGSVPAAMQRSYISRHLAECKCSDQRARDWLADLHAGVEACGKPTP